MRIILQEKQNLFHSWYLRVSMILQLVCCRNNTISSTSNVIESIIRYYGTRTDEVITLVQYKAAPRKFRRVSLSLFFTRDLSESPLATSFFSLSNVSWLWRGTLLPPEWWRVTWGPTSCDATRFSDYIIESGNRIIAACPFICFTIELLLNLILGYLCRLNSG